MRVKVAGIWKDSVPSVRVGGIWKQPVIGSVKVAGVWREFFRNFIDLLFTINNGTGLNYHAQVIFVQPDGKIFLGGQMTTINDISSPRLGRLNADGTVDTAFVSNIGTGGSQDIAAAAIQSDGKIVAGGSITFNDATVNHIFRLNADGTRDTAFTTNTGTGFNDNPSSIAVQTDGKIVIVGHFMTFNGATVNYIVRLNADGTRDTAFTTNTGTGFNSAPFAIAVQTDGKRVVGGVFTTLNGATVNRIARLNADGTPDTAFTTNTGTGANGAVNSIAVQTDGKIVLGGDFTTLNGATVNRIARLNANGTPDTAFTTNTGTGFTGFQAGVNTIAIKPDGKIVVGGSFESFNNTVTGFFAQLNASGTLDTAYMSNIGSGIVFQQYQQGVTRVFIQPDGKTLATGTFTFFNGTAANNLVRLL